MNQPQHMDLIYMLIQMIKNEIYDTIGNLNTN